MHVKANLFQPCSSYWTTVPRSTRCPTKAKQHSITPLRKTASWLPISYEIAAAGEPRISVPKHQPPCDRGREGGATSVLFADSNAPWARVVRYEGQVGSFPPTASLAVVRQANSAAQGLAFTWSSGFAPWAISRSRILSLLPLYENG